MRVEPYQERYLPDVVALIRLFHSQVTVKYFGDIDTEAMMSTIDKETAWNKENAFCLIDGEECVGFYYGFPINSTLNNKLIFQQVFLYVREESRRYSVRFLKEIEKVLRSKGIDIMIMTVLENYKSEPLKKFYQRLGYIPVETHLMRNL